jgi:hypothetical protein
VSTNDCSKVLEPEAKKYSKSSNEVVGIYKANILPNVAFSAVSMSLILGMSFMLADPYNKTERTQ